MKTEDVLQSKFVQTVIKPLFPSSVRRHARRAERWLSGDIGYDVQWMRVVYHDEWKRFFGASPTTGLSVLEISPGSASVWRDLGWLSYTSVQYPEFDITNDTLSEKFDVIIAEQVFEHLRHPYSAAKNIRAMLNDRGVFLIATPFLVRVHNEPGDYTRWTEAGLLAFLEDTGFTAETHSWGNQKCLVANLHEWQLFKKGRSLRNEPNLPLVTWAYARRTI
jgi:SAM-dependent methyltransferase